MISGFLLVILIGVVGNSTIDSAFNILFDGKSHMYMNISSGVDFSIVTNQCAEFI